jgi:LPS-assembly lipoprotein
MGGFNLGRRLVPVLAIAAAALSACAGFTPLYATPGVTPALESVEIATPQTRAGFMLREKIDDQFAHKLDQPALYRLNLKVAEKRNPRGLRVNNVASDVEEDLSVSYELVDSLSGAKLTQGFVPVSVFYVSADAPYAGIAAQQDAQERAANQVAIQIQLELSRYFAKHAAGASQAP